MKQDRTLLEQNLIKPTLAVKRKRNVVKDIKAYLLKNYDVFEGSVQSWINDPANELKELDPRLLFLFAEQIFQKTGDLNINPEDFFTPNEIKTAKQYSGKMSIEKEVDYPIVFKPAIRVGKHSWTTTIDIKTLVALLRARLLNWNPESQREATYKVVNGEVVEEATLYMENVHEIKNLLKQNKLEETQLTLNAAIGTADGDEEVYFDEDTFELQILNNAKIDVIDGYHRIMGSSLALSEKPDIEFKFEVKILNYTTPRAAEHLAQTSKRTPISETKRKKMGKESYADMVIDELTKSKIGDRISKKEMLSGMRKELVTYNTLSSAIDKFFTIEKKGEMFDVADYLTDFFDILFESYEEEFTTDFAETKKNSLLVDNNMFHGFVYLACRMKNNKIEARKVRKYLSDIDFSRDNPKWKELSVLDEKGRLTKKPKEGIEELIASINL